MHVYIHAGCLLLTARRLLQHVFMLIHLGILSGLSKLLLVMDQSEVRKIIKNCNGVREYMKVAEHVENLEEVDTFEKNLIPGLTTTMKQVGCG